MKRFENRVEIEKIESEEEQNTVKKIAASFEKKIQKNSNEEHGQKYVGRTIGSEFGKRYVGLNSTEIRSDKKQSQSPNWVED